MNNPPTISPRQADILLERYYDGLTDDNEECLLRRFLASALADGGKYDADRAVMGLILTGRRQYRRHQASHRRQALISAAAAACLMLMAAIWNTGGNPKADCIAYIHGQRITNPAAVEAQMHATLNDIAEEKPEQMMRKQLNEVLNLTE